MMNDYFWRDEVHHPPIFFCPRLHLLVEFLPQPACRELRPRWVEQIPRVLWPWTWIRSRQEISREIWRVMELLAQVAGKFASNKFLSKGLGRSTFLLVCCRWRLKVSWPQILFVWSWDGPAHCIIMWTRSTICVVFQLEDGGHQCKVSSWSSMKRRQPKLSWQPVRRRRWLELL